MACITIKNRRDFLFAAASGKKFITGSIILQMVKRQGEHPAAAESVRIGFTVSKKMGNAVSRNRIKRRLREAAGQIVVQYGKNGYDYVIISRPKALTCNFSELQRDMEFAFKQIIHHKSNNLKSNTSH